MTLTPKSPCTRLARTSPEPSPFPTWPPPANIEGSRPPQLAEGAMRRRKKSTPRAFWYFSRLRSVPVSQRWVMMDHQIGSVGTQTCALPKEKRGAIGSDLSSSTPQPGQKRAASFRSDSHLDGQGAGGSAYQAAPGHVESTAPPWLLSQDPLPGTHIGVTSSMTDRTPLRRTGGLTPSIRTLLTSRKVGRWSRVHRWKMTVSGGAKMSYPWV